MSHLSVQQALSASPGSTARVQGWVRTRRDSKAGLSFIHVNDGSCFDNFQIVAPADLANYAEEIQKLTTGCAIEATGTLVESQGQGQSVEMQASDIKVVGWVDDPDTYPVSAKRHTFEYLREQAHLRVRTNTFGAVTRVRDCLAQAVHRFFHERGFYWIHTPIITASDCEGAVNDLYVSCGGSVEGATAQQAYDACVSNSGGAGCIADAWNATSEDGTCEDYFANLSSRCGG